MKTLTQIIEQLKFCDCRYCSKVTRKLVRESLKELGKRGVMVTLEDNAKALEFLKS